MRVHDHWLRARFRERARRGGRRSCLGTTGGGSSARSAMTADPERPIEVRDVDPEFLLLFRSTSDIVRYQPDPYHLKQLVTDLKNFQARASRARVPDGFIRLV